MPAQGTAVFVSYSHADASLVAPVVKLLRVNTSLVFQDIDQIRPGKKWRTEIANALAEAQLVVVFWCAHASRSDEVAKEWKAAIEQDKDLLPLLLDETPLPPELSEFQWIDFRGTVGANHTPLDAPAAAPMAPARYGRRLFIPGLAAAATLAGVALFTTLQMSKTTVSDIAASDGSPPPPPLPESVPGSNLILPVSIVLLLAMVAAWFLKHRSKHVKASVQAGSETSEVERRIAAKLEAEILRRTMPMNTAEP